ncbi:retrovirus-related pol polyprotein from transposon TNT 1-94 [Tanacetum coccineum]
MLPEWGRFVMAIKLNRGLKESNHDQLYAYLKQHELHANENKMLMERLNQHSHDPLSLVSNVSPYQYPSSSSVPPQPSYISPVTHQPQFADNTLPNTGLSPADELLDSLTKKCRMAGLWFRMFRTDKTGFKETMLGVLLLQGMRGVQNRAGNVNVGKGKPIKCYNCNGIGHIARNCNKQKRPQNSNYFKEKMLLMQAQENGVDLDKEQLLFLAGGQTNTFDDDVDKELVQDMAQNEDNIFQVDQCDAFDSDVDEAPTAQTMFMANLSSAGLVYDKAGPSYDSDTISKVQDHEKCLDNINVYLEEHEMQNDVQPNNVFDSDTEYTSNSNIISYEQYVQENEEQVVQSNVSSVPNDAASVTAKLARYKELPEVYEKRAQFKLTKRELMIDTQMRMIIKDRNVKEESLQKELHSVKMQLNSTINHNKLIREEVSTLKHDFKQKENKLLEEFLDMKHLKEKIEDKLYKQDQSLQTVYMLCKPKSFYDEINRVAIGSKNPFYLSKAKQVQPALYNGHEIVKTNHARPLVYDSEDTLEIVETIRKQMIEKMKDPECVKKKVKIAPHNYSKENYIATFTPKKQLTPEQIFWSEDLLKIKAKALKEKAKSAKPSTAMTVYHPNTPTKLVPKVLPTKVKYK